MEKQIIIRKATIDDAFEKGYVHYHAWNEAYTGLIDQEYLDSRSLEKCVSIAKRYPDNTYVALVNKRVVGFACYMPYRGDDLHHAGEINAIYVLKEFNGMGIGKQLMDRCFLELSEYTQVALWVLQSNIHAIRFYEKLGFQTDGIKKNVKLSNGASICEIRMVISKQKENIHI